MAPMASQFIGHLHMLYETDHTDTGVRIGRVPTFWVYAPFANAIKDLAEWSPIQTSRRKLTEI